MSGQASGARDAGDVARPGARLPLMRQALFGLVFRGGAVALAFASQVVVARALGVAGFGTYVTILTWTTLLALLAGAGLPQAALRFLAGYAETRDWASYRGFMRLAAFAVAGSGILAGLAAVALFAAVPSLRPAVGAMATGMLLIVLFGASMLVQSAQIAAHHPLRAELANNVLRSVLVIVLVGGAWWAGATQHAETALAMTVLAGLLTVLAQVGGWHHATGAHWRGPADWRARPEWLASGQAYLIATVAYALIERLDTILLAALAGPAEVGPYSVAARLALLVSVALTPISAIASASAAQLLARGDRAGLQRLMAQTALLYSGAGVALAAMLVVAAPWLLGAFGAGFVEVRGTVAVLMLGQAAVACAGPAGALLAIAGRNRVLIGIMLAAVLADIALCLVLVPLYGATGAAVATSMSLAGAAIALAGAARRLLAIDTTVLAGAAWLVRLAVARAASRPGA